MLLLKGSLSHTKTMFSFLTPIRIKRCPVDIKLEFKEGMVLLRNKLSIKPSTIITWLSLLIFLTLNKVSSDIRWTKYLVLELGSKFRIIKRSSHSLNTKPLSNGHCSSFIKLSV